MKKFVWIVTTYEGEIQKVYEKEKDAHDFADAWNEAGTELYVDKYEVE